MEISTAHSSRLNCSGKTAISDRASIDNILVNMDILFVLIPLSVALALLILGALGWAVWRGQFESVDAEGERILRTD